MRGGAEPPSLPPSFPPASLFCVFYPLSTICISLWEALDSFRDTAGSLVTLCLLSGDVRPRPSSSSLSAFRRGPTTTWGGLKLKRQLGCAPDSLLLSSRLLSLWQEATLHFRFHRLIHYLHILPFLSNQIQILQLCGNTSKSQILNQVKLSDQATPEAIKNASFAWPSLFITDEMGRSDPR